MIVFVLTIFANLHQKTSCHTISFELKNKRRTVTGAGASGGASMTSAPVRARRLYKQGQRRDQSFECNLMAFLFVSSDLGLPKKKRSYVIKYMLSGPP